MTQTKRGLLVRRFAVLVLGLLVAGLLAACGDNTATPAPAATTAASTTAAASATTAAASTTAAAATTAAASATTAAAAATTAAAAGASTGGNTTGVTDSEVVIGSWGPQSGPAAAYGAIDRTIDAYFKMVNEQGGVNGRKIKFIYQDDAYQASQTQSVVKKMVEQDKVFAFVGGLGTANNLAVMDYLVQTGVPHVAPSTGSSLISQPLKKNIFALQTNYIVEATLLTRYVIDNLKTQKIGVFYQDDAFGKEGLEAIKAAAKAKGKDVVAEVSYQATDKDYSSSALKLQNSGADTVIFWSVPGPTGLILQEIDRIGYKPTLALSAVANDPTLFKLSANTISNAWITAWLPDVTDPTNNDPKVVAYRDFMKKYAPNETIGGFSVTGYTYGQLMTEALKRAGKDLTREKLIAAMETFNNWNDSMGYNVTYTATNHQGQNAVYFQQADAKQGRFVKKSDFVEYKPS
jgi:ABC-type branched-subunit amino acid transport system substrate-binding protein